MRPMLKSALRRSWRDRESVQFGVDPDRAVVLEPVDGATAGFLGLLDGTRGSDVLVRDAAALGLGPDRVRQLLGVLAEGGVLDDAAARSALSAAVRHRTAVLDRLRPDLAALSVIHPAPGAAAARIRHRRASRVRVYGAGRVGAALASVLSAAGVGAVDLVDGGRVEPWDVAPGGLPAEHIGDRRDAAGRGAVRRASPEPRPRRAGGGPECGSGSPYGAGPPYGAEAWTGHGGGSPARGYGQGSGGAVMAVVAPRDGLGAYAPDPAEARLLVAAGVPHLYTGVLEGLGVVGPLVVPGRTACGECVGLRLADGDPAWPRMLAQLRSGRQPAVPACDVALATTLAGLAAAHVLAHLDGRAAPSLGARVELSLARLSTRVRALPGDPRCGCGAGASTAATGAGAGVGAGARAGTGARTRAGAGASAGAGARAGARAGGGAGTGPRGGGKRSLGVRKTAGSADEDKAPPRRATDGLFAGTSMGRGTMAM